MIKRADYSIIYQFINTYHQQGFENINHQDELILALEAHLSQKKQFIYVADLMLMKIKFISQSTKNILGVDPNDFDLSSIVSRVHPEDYHKHNLARAMVIKKGYELLINKKGISIHSTCSRVQHHSGYYIESFIQVYSFFCGNRNTVFAVLILTDLSTVGTSTYKNHYYVGSDPAMFRYPDEALLAIGLNFSDREFEIIKLIAEGLDSEHIANQLSLSLNTINTHRRNILKKTKKATLRDLIIELREKGILV